jgi:hypothetical protein
MLKSKPASHLKKNDILVFTEGTYAGRQLVVAKVEQHDELPDRIKVWFSEPSSSSKKKSESYPYCALKSEQIYYVSNGG